MMAGEKERGMVGGGEETERWRVIEDLLSGHKEHRAYLVTSWAGVRERTTVERHQESLPALLSTPRIYRSPSAVWCFQIISP